MQQLEEKGQKVQWLKSVFSPRRTLLVIDMQNDFINGSLPVAGAEDIIDMVEALTKMDIWYQVTMMIMKTMMLTILLKMLVGSVEPGLASFRPHLLLLSSGPPSVRPHLAVHQQHQRGRYQDV